jgi:RNA polymerase sigma-70 factor (ECF subfamily)
VPKKKTRRLNHFVPSGIVTTIWGFMSADVQFISLSVDEHVELVRRAQARDEPAFAQLYRSHVGRVYAVCLRMTADATRAEELTQQTFVCAWEKLPLFRAESAFSSWLHRIAVNIVLMEMRGRARLAARIIFTDDSAVLEFPLLAPQPGTRLDLEQAIAALPPQARAIFVLHDVEGWQHNEIAEQLGLATGTTKAQLHRARCLLREALR